MPHDRYYLDAPLLAGESVVLEEGEWHHLANVARGRCGDPIDLINGKGQIAHATITALRKSSATVQIDEVEQETRKKSPLILIQALPRMNHLEWIIEKGTELDVTSFWLFPDFSVKKRR